MESIQEAVIQAIIDSITDTSKTAIAGKNWFKFEDDELSTLHLELICLLISAIDLAAFVFFKSNQKERSAFMDSFYNKLEDHYSWLPPEIASQFDVILYNRIDAYGRIISAYEDYDHRIAEFFTNLFGRKNDQEMVQIVQYIFMQHLIKIKEILENYFEKDCK